ncbi:hypothetical protein HZF05_02925 [Sphingomonas sp. CGMCC 1.13654]|uniref:MobA/MobL protein domain-containing protein n=1 Tax=Sphingomonas chungangi TaxID=2683589 RepID=A0A838L0M3_9SPHN|nr:hypothetical protein [Sphingomonas chungangi]MBA2933043.1 hypothetical protein [Sphingomonas chungangi]MVW56663.1 hypothetical protein [Sphingomonas chungangi]
MAKRKTVPAATAALPALPDRAVLLNATLKPDPTNPHSQLPLIGDPPGAVGLRVMWGVLRSRYREYDNSASAFVAAKLRPSWSPDLQAVTAAWAETLAPVGVDDSFADAVLLAARIDREIARDAAGATPLLGYATITDPDASRLHVFREELRGVARELVEAHGGAVVAVVHAPARAGSGNPLHGHLCLSTLAIDGRLGFSTRITPFCSDRGREVIRTAWQRRRRLV